MSVESIDTILNAKLLTKKSNVNHRTRVESELTVPVCKFLLGTRTLPNDQLIVIKEKHNLSMQCQYSKTGLFFLWR